MFHMIDPIENLRTFSFAMFLLLVDKDLIENSEEFQKYMARSTHILEQEEARLRDKAIADMSEKDRKAHKMFNILFGQDI